MAADPENESEESAVPPVVTCASCRRPECLGCEARPLSNEPAAPLSRIPWEAKGRLGRRLWGTAIASSSDPVGTFGEMPEGSIGAALGFALLAETLAIGSIGVAVALAALVVAPRFSAGVLSEPAVLGLAAAGIVFLSSLMVGLHALWGICLELGVVVSKGAARWRLGVRFGLYACGWDLLTSPVGLVEGLLSRGSAGVWGPIAAAVRAPRAAIAAYQQRRRGMGREAVRRGIQISIAVLGSAVLLLAVAILLLAGYLAFGGI